MPFTFLAHQAAVVPLKLARPSWFDGTALAIGSMAPDFEYAWQELPDARWGHTAQGVLLFAVPATLVLATLVRRVVARPLAAHLPDGPLFRLRDYAALERGLEGRHAWARAAASALLGATSHVVWDAITHADTFVTSRLPWLETVLWDLRGIPIRVTGVLQIASSVGGIAFTLAALHLIARRRALLAWSGAPPLELQATRASGRALLACVALGTAAGLAASAIGHASLTPYVLAQLGVRTLFRTTAGLFTGLVLGCLLARSRLGAPRNHRSVV